MNAPPFGARPRPGQPEPPVLEAAQESCDEGGGATGSGSRQGPAVVRHPLNQNGRDYVVGDIHGMFAHLEGLLADLEFEPGRDRLFSVGDLVDRGPESHRALEWLARPWFHACRGNHEQFAIDSADPEQHDLWVRYNGGEWWLQLRESDHGRFRTAFQKNKRRPVHYAIMTSQGIIVVDIHLADQRPAFEPDRNIGDDGIHCCAMGAERREKINHGDAALHADKRIKICRIETDNADGKRIGGILHG